MQKVTVIRQPKYIPVPERSLTTIDSQSILSQIETLQNKYSIKNSRILFNVSDGCNQRKFAYQLADMLKRKGFTVDVSSTGEMLSGIRIEAISGFYDNDRVIQILVGTSI
jgi:hypothetical protein